MSDWSVCPATMARRERLDFRLDFLLLQWALCWVNYAYIKLTSHICPHAVFCRDINNNPTHKAMTRTKVSTLQDRTRTKDLYLVLKESLRSGQRPRTNISGVLYSSSPFVIIINGWPLKTENYILKYFAVTNFVLV